MTARILIVDDVPANTRLLEAKLAADYYQVSTALDGVTALNLAKSWQPDLILLDVMMPGIDGFECCRRLKEDPDTMHIPVVMVTALGEPAERVRGLEAGADDFLTKPVELETLMARVRSLVRLKRLLDEWRARGDTARALGLGMAFPSMPLIAGARVLVIDDWDGGAQIVQDALGREGGMPERARDIDAALAMTAQRRFDLIVLSLSMTSGDPLMLASRLRAADATHEIPLLVIAEPDMNARVLRGFDLGANDWLLRPVDENELRARARNQLRRKFYQDRLREDLGHALELALTDALTGLYNRRYLMRHLQVLLSARQASSVAVLMLDVDNFKTVNDEFGHAAGDNALRQIALALRANTRAFDSLARYGGEEFVVVMPGASEAEAMVAAERLRTAVAKLTLEAETGSGQPPISRRLTISIGVACCNRSGVTAEALLSAADQSLYGAKRGGRNRVERAETV
jgi:two-component system cell cycle response regulator